MSVVRREIMLDVKSMGRWSSCPGSLRYKGLLEWHGDER